MVLSMWVGLSPSVNLSGDSGSYQVDSLIVAITLFSVIQKVCLLVTEACGKSRFMAGEMALQLGVYASVAEVVSSIPTSNHSF